MWEYLEGMWGGEYSDVPFVNLDKLFDVAASFALYVTVALLLGLIIAAVVIRNRDEVYLAGARKTMLGVVIGYSAGIISVLGFIKLLYYYFDGKINTNFYLVAGMFALILVLVAAGIIIKKRCNPTVMRWYTLGAVVLAAAYAVVLVCVIPAKGEAYEPLNAAGMYCFSAALVAAAVLSVFFFDKGRASDSARSVSYAAICIAASFALSYIKLFSLPQGGSVTFASLLPLMLYAYMFGPKRGMIAGVVYGMLQFIQSPQFYHPMQVLLDYPIAFGVIGLAGIAKNFKFLKGNIIAEFSVGAVIGVLFRYFAHVISGYYVFSSWRMEGYTALSWAFVYNLFNFADLAIVLVAGVLALSSRSLRRQINAVSAVSV